MVPAYQIEFMHANVFLQGLCCAEGFYLFISLKIFTDLSGFLINVQSSPGFINASWNLENSRSQK